MSNRAFLLSNNATTPAGRDSDGNPNYDHNADTIAEGGSMLLPVFWFTLFDASHIKFHVLEDYRIPTLVCERADGLNLLEKHKAATLSLLTGYESHWDRWEQIARNSRGSHFKMDLTEIWDLGPDEFESGLTAAVRWFTSGSQDDLAVLLGQSAMYRDPTSGRFRIGSEDVTGEHLYGYVFQK